MILSGSKDEFDGYYDTIYVLNRKLDNLTNVLKSKYPKYYNLKYNLNLFSIKEIQSQLDSTECLVSYTDGEYYYLAAFITKTTFSIKTIEVDENFDEELKYLRYSMMYPKSERFKKIFLKNASEVYETLFPVKFDKNIEKLIIIPDSRLSTIPFEALLTNPTEIETEYSDYPFLLKDYNICYHYTEKLAFEEYKTTKSDVVSDFIAFAPVFSDKSTNSTNQRTAQILQNMQSNSDTVVKNTRMVDRNFISALPGTEEEVKLIYNLFDSKDIKAAAYFYSSASESVVKSLDLTKYRFIHFATHGFADNENPELSGLILAHDSSKSEDNVLYLDEIIGLEMEPELAVLSACETGLGKIYKGEGMVGLSRSIIYSGAKNLCVSLWQVSDESTKKLMVDFYNYYLEQNANDHEFASSFRKAKLNLINSKSYSHPFYWAPFILIGK